MRTVSIDGYVLDTLLRDLAGHDKRPSAFLVFLHLWNRTRGSDREEVRTSHQIIAELTGLSRSSVQTALKRLEKRGLIRSARTKPTAMPTYRVLRPWAGSRQA